VRGGTHIWKAADRILNGREALRLAEPRTPPERVVTTLAAGKASGWRKNKSAALPLTLLYLAAFARCSLMESGGDDAPPLERGWKEYALFCGARPLPGLDDRGLVPRRA
jgi:hypothetical protein